MAITSSSTFAEIVAQIKTNLAYDLNKSAAQAKAFIEAGRAYLLIAPKVSQQTGGDGGTRVEFEIPVIERMLEKAERWLASNPSAGISQNTGGKAYFDLRDCRE